jgi:hypothetical protein
MVADQSFDPRAELRSAHQQRDVACTERDRLAAALDRARAELQSLLDAQRERDAAREAEMARLVAARTEALIEGEGEGAEIVELVTASIPTAPAASGPPLPTSPAASASRTEP